MSRHTTVAVLVGVLAAALALGAPTAAGAATTGAAVAASTAASTPSVSAESLGSAPAVTEGTTTSPTTAERQTATQQDDRVCSAAPAGQASCFLEVTPGAAEPAGSADTASPALGGDGLEPSDLRSAYGLTGLTGSSSATIAVVDAYDAPDVESDLATYRAAYGLGPCTIASGCLTKRAQNGSTSAFPQPDLGWAQESTADLEMASAICPQCRLMLVEADSTNIADLGSAVNTAIANGAQYVSNSYGSTISGSQTAASFDSSYYRHAGVVITAAAGDGGYGASYPASSPWVTAVGGTTLSYQDGSWQQRTWSGTGSGCGTYGGKPSWQGDALCGARSMNDVAAAAAGIALYLPGNGWTTGGGTSLSSPIIAAVYALAGAPAADTYPAQYPYQHTEALTDVTSGANGSCGVAALCNAAVGYDGPTGLGTPDGVAAFRSSALAVSRVAGTDAYDTAAQTAALGGYPSGLDRVYVATRAGFADALAGGAAAGASGAPILLVAQDSVPARTASELASLRPAQVVVLGGPDAVSDQVATSLAQYATDTAQPVLRDAGSDRWATSAAVSADVFRNGSSTVYIATGTNFPDALSGAAMAATSAHRGPILLVPGDSIPGTVTDELRRLDTVGSGISRVVVLGGPSAVTDAVAGQLAAYGTVARLSGADRFATSSAISRASYDSATTVYVATGTDFPDALAGAPVAARTGAPILLVTAATTPGAIQAEIDRLGATHVVVLGGTSAVGAGAVATL